MTDNGYDIWEADDPRTWDGSLVPDCEKVVEEPFEEEDEIPPVLEYIGEFKNLIDACGQVAYFWHMYKYVKNGSGTNKAKIVASAYNHDLRYYNEQYRDWKTKANISFSVLCLQAGKLGYTMPADRTFLNDLTLSEDRRKAYKDYLSTCLKKHTTLSPQEMEKKYQKRLKKRFNDGK